LKTLFVDEQIKYTGEQLRSLWAYMNFNLKGDCIVAFVGGCDVDLTEMVDMADVKEEAKIFSRSMLHFIVEHFDTDLEKAILRQRLLVEIARCAINEMLGRDALRREGDDLFDGDRKLSVSIATASPVSTLIHFGLNISSRDTPVPTVGLEDYKIAPRKLADVIMERYAREMDEIDEARAKVRGVD